MGKYILIYIVKHSMTKMISYYIDQQSSDECVSAPKNLQTSLPGVHSEQIILYFIKGLGNP